MTAINSIGSHIGFFLLVLIIFCEMAESFEIKFVQRGRSEVEVDPSVCKGLTDDNIAESEIIVPYYDQIKDSISLDILSPTNFTHVPVSILRKFPKLQQLRIMNSQIRSLDRECFHIGDDLRLIDMRNNRITCVPEKAFEDMRSLEELNLSHNEIASIEAGAFHSTPSLKTIVLSNNLLESVGATILVDASELRELYLESNRIRDIAVGALDLPNLEIISLKDNRLASLPAATFENASKVEKIDLSGNELTELNGIMKTCSNVYSLNLSNNPGLKTNPFILAKQLPSLSYLNLAQTELNVDRQGSEDGEGTSTITLLDLSSNNLNSTDVLLQLSKFKSLKTIVLKGNAFTRLDHVSELKRIFPRLSSIQLENNLHLDEEWIREFQPILRRQKIKMIVDHE